MIRISESYGVRGPRFTTLVYGKTAAESERDSGNVYEIKRPWLRYGTGNGRHARTVTVTSRREYEGLVGINGQLL